MATNDTTTTPEVTANEATPTGVPAETTTSGSVEPTAIKPDAVEAPVAATDTTPSQENAPEGISVQTVQPAPTTHEQGVIRVEGDVPAQVVGPAQPTETTIPAREAVYHSDQVILDTSDPLAVQPLPRVQGDLPELGSPLTAEQQFARR